MVRSVVSSARAIAGNAVVTLLALAGPGLAAVAIAADQAPVAAAQERIREAVGAYRDGDLDSFVASLEAALTLNPSSLWTRHNLARGYARTGRSAEALVLLDELAAMKIDMGFADDPDFAALSELPAFATLVDAAAEATAPVLRSRPWLEFPQAGLVPEGIAVDPGSGRFFFGSMRTGDVYVIDGARRVSKFAGVDAAGRLSAIGLAVDTSRGLLWVVGAAFDIAENFSADSGARSGVFGFDLESGTLVEEYRVDDEAGLNDVALAPDGRLYASGTSLYRIDPDDGGLEIFDTDIDIVGSNGIAVSPDGGILVTSSYPVGLFAVDLATGATRRLAEPPSTTLYGIDGLYWHEGDLIGVQNGTTPWRLVRLRVNADVTAVTAIDYLEVGNPATEPMTGAIIANRIYYIGEGPEPAAAPAQFPPAMQGNLGSVVIREAPLETRK